MAFGVQFGTVMDASGKPKLNFWITTLGAIVNLACNYVFISWFGVIGAAYGTLLAMFLMFSIMQILLNRIFGVQLVNVFKYAFSFYGEALTRLKQFKTLQTS
jgi:O-antigen/teichoic acid export membrane protein